MVRKGASVEESPVEPMVEDVAPDPIHPVIVTRKDRMIWDRLIGDLMLIEHERRIAYLSIGPSGVTVAGRKVPVDTVPWAS